MPKQTFLPKLFFLTAFAASTSFVGLVSADGLVDGQRGANYGSAFAVQTVETQFGDNLSELDAAYAYSQGNTLYLLFTGNLEQNFNKLNIFIDNGLGGGENVLSSTPDYDFFNGTDWISSNYGGLTFDSGFNADYHIFVRSGGGDNYEVDFIDRLGGGSTIINGNMGSAVGLGTIAVGNLAANAGASALTSDISFFFDNSNTAGVIGGTAAADQAAAAAVTTGFELAINLANLGLDPTVDNTIRIAAIIGNGDHNFASNQTLAGLTAPQGNLGGDGAGNFTGSLSGINFNNFSGDQFFTINISGVPEPTEVTADSILVTEGTYVSGGIAELAVSDNARLTLRRADPEGTQYEVKGVSPVDNPSSLEVTLEGTVFARFPITQTIELYDYDDDEWVLVDSSISSYTTVGDTTVNVSATGDLSRFVEDGTRCIEARIQYRSGIARQRFTSYTDQFVWTIFE